MVISGVGCVCTLFTGRAASACLCCVCGSALVIDRACGATTFAATEEASSNAAWLHPVRYHAHGRLQWCNIRVKQALLWSACVCWEVMCVFVCAQHPNHV